MSTQQFWEVIDNDPQGPVKSFVEEQYVEREVEQIKAAADNVDQYVEDRVDLRDVPTYAIDPASACDYDDAWSVVRDYNDGDLDGYTAWIHIADVPEYVEEGSILDEHAEDQGFTIYYGDSADHMLPSEVADTISLSEGKDSLANTVELSFDADGELQNYDIYASVINPDRNLSYTEANELVKQPKNAPWTADRTAEIISSLEDASFIATKLSQDGERDHLSRTSAYKMVEEFMIKANEIGANELLSSGNGIYRIHVPPENRAHAGSAQYSDDCQMHDGLGVDQYAHLTSPIRRYPDIVNWRIIRDEIDAQDADLQQTISHLNKQETRIESLD